MFAIAWLRQPPLLTTAAAPQLVRMVSQAAGVTWSGVRMATSLALPESGTRAGMPFGDMLFIASFAPARAKVHERLKQQGLLVPVQDVLDEISGLCGQVARRAWSGG
eukprot:5761697-Pyramimonas_sp.AAC.1